MNGAGTTSFGLGISYSGAWLRFSDPSCRPRAHLQTLHELIYESISVSEILPVADVLRRSHVAEALRYLMSRENHTSTRSALRMELGLRQANLTRIMAMALNTGLVAEKQREKVLSIG